MKFKYSEAKIAEKVGLSRYDIKKLRDKWLKEGQDWRNFGRRGGVGWTEEALKEMFHRHLPDPGDYNFDDVLIGAVPVLAEPRYERSRDERVCEACGKTYMARRDDITANRARFCSKECHASIMRHEGMPEVSREKKRQVYAIVEKALASGKLIKSPCVVCGNQDSESHHEDYDKPIEVIWLCRSCHTKRHMPSRGGTQLTIVRIPPNPRLVLAKDENNEVHRVLVMKNQTFVIGDIIKVEPFEDYFRLAQPIPRDRRRQRNR